MEDYEEDETLKASEKKEGCTLEDPLFEDASFPPKEEDFEDWAKAQDEVWGILHRRALTEKKR